MSGGEFDYLQYRIDEIANNIQLEIDRNGKEIPSNKLRNDKEYYEKYPEEKFYYKYPNEIINEFKNAVMIIKKAAIYVQRIDWLLSGDDGEETFLEKLKDELNELENN